jgi:hypothetical protein
MCIRTPEGPDTNPSSQYLRRREVVSARELVRPAAHDTSGEYPRGDERGVTGDENRRAQRVTS